MKRTASLLLMVSAMALSGCWFTDLFKKKNNEPEQGEKDDPKEKYITGIVQVLAPSSIEQGTALTSVQVKVSYSDGSQDVVTSTRVEIDTNTVGTATGTAYVNNFSASFSVEVYSSNIPTHHGVFSTYGTEDVAGDGYIDFKLKNESEDKIEVRAEKVAYEGNVPKAKKDS